MQDWDSIYDRNGKRNFDAYNIGSSFIFFIIDCYSLNELRIILNDISETKDFFVSLNSKLGVSISEVELKWKKYIYEFNS